MSDYTDMVAEEMAEAWLEQGKRDAFITLYRDGKLTSDDAAKYLGVTVEEFLGLAKEEGGN